MRPSKRMERQQEAAVRRNERLALADEQARLDAMYYLEERAWERDLSELGDKHPDLDIEQVMDMTPPYPVR